MAAYADWRNTPPGKIPDFADIQIDAARAVCKEAAARGEAEWLSAEEARRVLRLTGLPIPPGGVAETAEQAAAVAREIGFPVAVKLASRRLVHKTESGGVHLHLNDEAAVRDAYNAIWKRLASDGHFDAMDGVLVQQMMSGTELMVGMVADPAFGPLIAFGLGGIHVEILGDASFRVTPLTDRDAHEMVRSIRGYRLFDGYRGHPAADVPAMDEILLRVSRLVEEVPEIVELDLNPVFALMPGEGCRIADARIRVKPLDD
jgi:acyl-CoA synthetase (NDP forming)